jgi:hypothetical protein
MSLVDPRLNRPGAMRRVSRRLRLVLRLGAASTGAESSTSGVTSPEVEFVAYADDCLVSGRIALSAERLTDLLNAHDEFGLVNVVVTSLADGREIDVPEVTILRDDLLLAQATEPRGNVGRRRMTRRHAIAAQVGPYLVRGFLHSLPGSDPVSSLGRRNVMVPLTDASIEYFVGGERQHRQVDTVIVNQERMDWVVEDGDQRVDQAGKSVPVGREQFGVDGSGRRFLDDGGTPPASA